MKCIACNLIKLSVCLALLCQVDSSLAESRPEATQIEDISAQVKSDIAYLVRARLPGTEHHIGFIVLCNPDSPNEAGVDAFFLGFPEDRRPVQLMVATPGKDIEYFGRAVSGGPESGFHSPRIRGIDDVHRFVNASFFHNAIITNNWREMVNRIDPQENQSVKTIILDCLG